MGWRRQPMMPLLRGLPTLPSTQCGRHPRYFDVKVLVVEGAGFQAAVKDADEAVGELA
jgi:hypothetical protein